MNAVAEQPKQTAPVGAFAFGSDNIVFAESNDEATAPIQMLARHGGPISHWYWGKIVHDFDGMLHRDSIPIDYDHDTSEPIGYVDSFEVREGDLWLGGQLTSIAKGDEADKLMRRGRMNVPFQASIYFDDAQDLILEQIGEGLTAEVNGRMVEGPAVIVRQWHLRAVAVTSHGYDIHTESQFSKSSRNDGELSFTMKGASMPKNKLTAEASEATETEATTDGVSAETTTVETTEQTTETTETVAESEASEASSDTEASELSAAQKMVALFSDHFGPADAAAYFGDGLNLTQAALKHVGKLKNRITELEQERDAAVQKLSAAQLSHGESEAVDTGKPGVGGTPTIESIFRKQGSAN